MTFEELQSANSTTKTTNIKGKEYAEVNQRIKAFRMLFPNGSIQTDLLSVENGMCVIKATVSNEDGCVIGTGLAYEREDSSFINKTSYVENCETSAVGRALAMCGFGIDTSIASSEEVQNAIKNQEDSKEVTATDLKALRSLAKRKGVELQESKLKAMKFKVWKESMDKLEAMPDKE